MKILQIQVRREFTCPEIFNNEDIILREAALRIGAHVVQEAVNFVETNSVYNKTTATTTGESSSGNTAELIRKCMFEKNEAIKTHKLIADKYAEITSTLEEYRLNFESKMKEEKAKLKDEITNTLKCEIQLRERERFEVEAARMREKHERDLLKKDDEKQEVKQTLENLRKEHEGLVVKLMSRLEVSSSSQRGGGSSSISIGRSFEESVERVLRQIFGARQGFVLEDVHTVNHSGDFIMQFDGLRILLELKSYDPKTKVPTKEVEKLARDLSTIEPPCDAAIMISACSDITGFYSCGPLEVSSSVACVPVLFVNNFLSLGDPALTFHTIKVFFSLIAKRKADIISLKDNDSEEEDEVIGKLKRIHAECARRCNYYLADINKQSTELLKQVAIIKNSATHLRDNIVALIESETLRFNGILQLVVMSSSATDEEETFAADRTVFGDFLKMSDAHKNLIKSITQSFIVSGNHDDKCSTKDILTFIQVEMKTTSEKTARDIMKSVFLDSVIKHGYVVGLKKKDVSPRVPVE